jgi:hypothetical protein
MAKSGVPSAKNIFVGYCEETKGYRLIDSKKPMKVTKARDAMTEITKKMKARMQRLNCSLYSVKISMRRPVQRLIQRHKLLLKKRLNSKNKLEMVNQ